MTEKIIYNCHSHIFTHENIPNNFFPLQLVRAIRIKYIRWLLRGIMKIIVPFVKNDKVQRYANFIKAAYRKTQENNLKRLISYYPYEKSRFIILPMDMSRMNAGKVKEDIDAQHAELVRLYKKSEYRDILIPFAHIEPRRPNALNRLKTLIEKDEFKGVKIYPSLGYSPDHKILMEKIYPYMVENSIPLMAHCSPGSVYNKKIGRKRCYAFTHPDNYKRVMEAYPKLRVCLAHFGGKGEWKRQFNKSYESNDPTWFTKICELLRSESYPNLYVDISYTIFSFQENVPMLKVLLEDDKIISKVLFGSDFYMVESEKYSEKRFSIDLRASLGEDKFWQIANTNPKNYLGI